MRRCSIGRHGHFMSPRAARQARLRSSWGHRTGKVARRHHTGRATRCGVFGAPISARSDPHPVPWTPAEGAKMPRSARWRSEGRDDPGGRSPTSAMPTRFGCARPATSRSGKSRRMWKSRRRRSGRVQRADADVAATRIGRDEQLFGTRVRTSAHAHPPEANRCHGETWGRSRSRRTNSFDRAALQWVRPSRPAA